MTKCSKCGNQNKLVKIEIAKNCFRLWCESCCTHYNDWQHKKLVKSLYSRYYSMVSRCTDGSNPHYKDYGGRGIECRFTSNQEFINYIINDLKYDTYNKIRGLEIDRIDNNGHYEKDNIRLATHSENMKNRRKCKK